MAPEAVMEAHEQEQTRKTNVAIQASSAALVIIAVGIVLVICYLAKLVLVTLLVSILVAFMLEPLVTLQERVRIPRSVGALVAILVMLALGYTATYFFYNRAIGFIDELPQYTHKVKGTLAHVQQRTKQIEQTTRQIMPQENPAPKNSVPVTVQNASSSGLLTEHLAAVTEVAVTLTFIPFLVYFMLSWQEHARTKTVQLFRPEHRSTAYVTLGQISLMMRSFIAGNFIIGLFMSVCSVVVFGLLHLQYFYFIGFISGFLSLMPYLGVALAIVPPLAAGIGSLSNTELVIVGCTVLGLHMLSMNVLYPKVIGKRLQLNPLVVTMGLLVWGWIWGAMGLILAVPMLGAVKIVCDHVAALRPVGAWMGD